MVSERSERMSFVNPFYDISCNAAQMEALEQIGFQSMLIYDEVGMQYDVCMLLNVLANLLSFQMILYFSLNYVFKKAHSHFYAPWDYLVCFKDGKLRQRWYKTAAELETVLHERLHRTKSGKPILLYFDAPTMVSYQTPSKASETIECRKENAPPECQYEYRGFDPELFDPTYQNMAYSEQKTFDSVYSPIAERHMREIILKSNSSDWQNKSSIRKNPFQS